MRIITDPILEVCEITRYFGALTAVDNIKFKAERGHITSIIGPNGAGKSTLFNLISGSIAPQQGKIMFNGKDVTKHSVRAKTRLGIARSFQITNLFFEMTVLENLRLAAQILEPFGRGHFSVEASSRVWDKTRELLEKFELARKASKRAGELSHGERRRLEIALALASEPELLLLDEPTQGMSHADTEETAQLIKSLSEVMSVLLIEHDIDLVMDLSDHVVVMHQGRRLSEGTPQEVRADPAVKDAYLGHA